MGALDPSCASISASPAEKPSDFHDKVHFTRYLAHRRIIKAGRSNRRSCLVSFSMSDRDKPSRPFSPASARRSRTLLITLAVLTALIGALTVAADFWTDLLWYRSVDYSNVFTTQLWTRIGLFGFSGLAMAALVGLNIVVAYRVRPSYSGTSPEQRNLDRYRLALQPYHRLLVLVITGIIGIIAGISAASQWRTWLQWRHRVPFGAKDPQFGKDIGLYVFQLPWWRVVLGFGFAAVVVCLLVAVATHYLYGGLRLQNSGNRATPAAQTHLSIVLGLFLLLKAVAYYLDRYSLVVSERSAARVTGASYTDVNAVLPAKTILMIIAALCAVAFFANAMLRNFQIPAIALVLLVVSSLLVGGAYPLVVQQFQVKPNADQTEREPIARNIAATRQAYGIDDVQKIDYAATTDTSAAARATIRSNTGTIRNARLLDPNVLPPTYDQLQRILNFYGFADKLDIDRYLIDGTTQDYVVGVRELDPSKLTGNQTSWINRHLVYTCGNGFVAAPANQVTPDGQPDFTTKDLPTTGNISVDQPRVCFGELLGDTYSIVGKTEEQSPREFLRPGEGGTDIKTTYNGTGGVSIGNVINRLAFAAHYRERNILFSDAISEESKILYIRDPRERVAKVAPFLKLDGDPYPAVIGGQITWIVDGYTTSDGVPFSQRQNFGEVTRDSLTGQGTTGQPKQQINYIRNSIKATVDAYDGTVTLYQFGARDPVLETWKRIFPGLIQPEKDISPQLRAHFRYPEDLFKAQRELLAKYHISDPVQFFNLRDVYEVPKDPQIITKDQAPFYLFSQNPGQDSLTFQLTTPLNALNRPNLAAYLTASSNPKDYGTLRMLVLSPTTTVPGPEQVQSQFNSTPEVASSISLLDQRGSNVIYGNLLTLPVGGGLLYVQPLYVQGEGAPYPLLRKVLASFGDKVAYEDTLSQALDRLFGSGAGEQAPDQTGRPTESDSTPELTEAETPTAEPDQLSPELSQAISDIQEALADLKKATQDGDFAGVGRAQADLEKATREFEAARSGSGGSS